MTGAAGSGAGPVAVIGAGSWGTAFGIHLRRAGVETRLWARDPDLAEAIRRTGENARYLPGLRIPDGLRVSAVAAEVLAGVAVVVVAVPSHFLRVVIERLAHAVPSGAMLLSATKGLEPDTRLRMSEVLRRRLARHPVAVLSGPSFAREVAIGQPAALVVASAEDDVARGLQRRLSSREFRLYTNRDVLGVELAGALKNVIAIGTGLSDGLGLGENARAALITRGLVEITRLGVALGAAPGTFAGLAGLGDLVLTCTGSLSRNRTLGLLIGQGRSLAEAEGASHMVAEGVRTVASALELARRVAVAMPICEEVRAVLFDGKPVAGALAALLAREPKPEDEAARLR
jgi:glycerol-3-phosphate dehydrogenase (NAD(P)+)